MDTKEKIIRTLNAASHNLHEIKAEWCIIGTSAMILSGIYPGETFDIDILTTCDGAEEFKRAFHEYIDTSPATKDDNLFRSNFVRFKLPLMDMEVMGNLQVRKNGLWHPVTINDCRKIPVGSELISIPDIHELRNLFLLFGREKDLKKIRYFDDPYASD